DQGCCREGLPRLLLGWTLGRQVAQLVVDQRQELLRSGRVAVLDRRKDARDLAPEVIHNPRQGNGPASWREAVVVGKGAAPGVSSLPCDTESSGRLHPGGLMFLPGHPAGPRGRTPSTLAGHPGGGYA